ncbi:MAG: hypothetical protein ABR547_09735 [Halanaerobium sp.]
MKNKLSIFILVLLISNFFAVPVMAQNDLESRLELIEASQQLQQNQQQEENAYQRHRFGVTLSNFGSADTMVNPGLRIENQLTDTGSIKAISELYYLREEEDLAAFISLAFSPASFGYLGLGAELSGKADYQIFAGLNLTENIYLELKGVNEDGSFEDSELYFATGFMIGF